MLNPLTLSALCGDPARSDQGSSFFRPPRSSGGAGSAGEHPRMRGRSPGGGRKAGRLGPPLDRRGLRRGSSTRASVPLFSGARRPRAGPAPDGARRPSGPGSGGTFPRGGDSGRRSGGKSSGACSSGTSSSFHGGIARSRTGSLWATARGAEPSHSDPDRSLLGRFRRATEDGPSGGNRTPVGRLSTGYSAPELRSECGAATESRTPTSTLA